MSNIQHSKTRSPQNTGKQLVFEYVNHIILDGHCTVAVSKLTFKWQGYWHWTIDILEFFGGDMSRVASSPPWSFTHIRGST